MQYTPSVFRTHFRPRTKRQAGQVWTHLLFLRPVGAAKMLVGEPPQTRHFGTKCPKVLSASQAAIAPVPYRHARQSRRADDPRSP